MAFESGSRATGTFPPVLFIKKRKTPKTEVFKLSGATSTSVTNRIPNQVSAAKNYGL